MGRFAEPRVVPEGNSLTGTLTLPGGGIGVYTVIQSAETARELRSSWGSGVGRRWKRGSLALYAPGIQEPERPE